MKLKAWWQVLRYHYTTSSFLPCLVVGTMIWSTSQNFSWSIFVFTILILIIHQLGLNTIDDYFDFKQNVDVFKNSSVHTYTSGSGILPSGNLSHKSILAFSLSCYLIALTAGIWLSITRGLPIFLLIILGVIFSFFYTAPPIKLSYRGFGEIGFILFFGPLIGLGVDYVLRQQLTWESALLTLPLGLTQFSMIVLQEIVDYREDCRAGKINIVARFGKKTGFYLHVVGISLVYFSIIIAVLADKVSPMVLLTLIALPHSISAAYKYFASYNNEAKMERLLSNFPTFKTHNLLAILLIIAYIGEGLSNGKPIIEALLLVAIFNFFYFPVTLKLIKDNIGIRQMTTAKSHEINP